MKAMKVCNLNVTFISVSHYQRPRQSNDRVDNLIHSLGNANISHSAFWPCTSSRDSLEHQATALELQSRRLLFSPNFSLSRSVQKVNNKNNHVHGWPKICRRNDEARPRS